MRTHTSSVLFTAALLFMGTSCKKDEAASPSGGGTPVAAPKIPYAGSYSWAFTIPGMGDQLSSHVFYADSVEYRMTGAAYTTDYAQLLTEYKPAEDRLITVGKGGSIPKDGVYFVMFFKDVTDSTLTIYKRECGEGAAGLEEARTFAFPAPGATTDHGWNVYLKD